MARLRFATALSLLVLPSIAMASLFGTLFAGERPAGVGGGALAPCPDTANCVSSRASDAAHAVPPIAFRGEAAQAMRALASVAATLPGARVVTARDDYLHVEASSKVMGFVDDLEAVPDGAAGVVHVRSASRVGRSDFGVNRKRVEALREAFAAATARGTAR